MIPEPPPPSKVRKADLLVIADGLAEPPSGHTTLMQAHTPALDLLASRGTLCRIDPQEGVPPGEVSSERGIARLLGVSLPGAGGPGRASALSTLAGEEASGFGWFYVATPALLDYRGTLLRYVNDPENEDAFWSSLIGRQPSGASFRLLPVRKGPRIGRMLVGLARIPGGGREEGVPPRRGLPVSLSPCPPDFDGWVRAMLGPSGWRPERPDLAINGTWLWGGGPSMDPVDPADGSSPEAGAIVADTLLVQALGRWRGYAILPLSRSTGDVDTDLREKGDQVFEALRKGVTRVLLHLEGFDMASHRGDRPSKVRFLERVDREIFARLLPALDSGLLTSLRITSDHQSSPDSGNHESGPVPALFVGGVPVPRGDTGRPGRPRRMTELAASVAPRISVGEWNALPLRQDGSPLPNNDGKDLCLASS